VANDQMALGVLSALAQLNRTGSSAVSVTGYDDTADRSLLSAAADDRGAKLRSAG
jgi:DNA-binding LacI/PurR family transcriptional regulator